MVSSMKSLMVFFLQGIKLLIHHPLPVLFVLLGMMAVRQIMIRMKQLLRILNKRKTSLLSLEVSNVMDQDYQIPVCLIELMNLIPSYRRWLSDTKYIWNQRKGFFHSI